MTHTPATYSTASLYEIEFPFDFDWHEEARGKRYYIACFECLARITYDPGTYNHTVEEVWVAGYIRHYMLPIQFNCPEPIAQAARDYVKAELDGQVRDAIHEHYTALAA